MKTKKILIKRLQDSRLQYCKSSNLQIFKSLNLLIYLLYSVFCILYSNTSFASDWVTFKANSQRTSATNEDISPPLTLKWSKNFNQEIYSSLVKYQDKLIVSVGNSKIYVLDAFSGTEIYQLQTYGKIFSTPSVENGILYVTTLGGRLEAYDLSNGSLLWRVSDSGTNTSSPLVDNGKIYYGSGHPNSFLISFDITGNYLWAYHLDSKSVINSSPAIINGKVVFGAADGKLYILDSLSGSLLNSFQTEGPFYLTSPALQNNIAYFAPGDYDKNIYAVNIDTGSVVWQKDLSNGDKAIKVSSTAIYNNKIYISAGFSTINLYCLEQTSGNILWQKNINSVGDNNILSTPAVANNTVFVGSLNGNLYSFNATDGTPLSTINLSSPILTSPALASGMIFAATSNGNVYAYATADTTNPTASITYPANSQTVNGSINITGTVTDEHFQKYLLDYGSGANPSSWINIKTAYSEVQNNFLATFNTALIPDGVYTLKLTSYDTANNTATNSVTMTVDNTAPVLNITSPTDATITKINSIAVSGTTEIGAVLKVQGNVVTVAGDGSFSTTLSLSEGTNVITITASDSLSNTATATKNVILDTTVPSLSVTNPTQDILTNQSNLTISGTAEVSSTVKINSNIINLDGQGNFSSAVQLTEGENIFAITSQDSAGNISTITRKVTLDTVAPILNITSPADGLITNSSSVTVTGNSETGASVKVNNNVVTLDAQNNFSLSINLQSGSNIITVTASDTVQNTTTKQITVVYDSLGPDLILSSPADNLLTNNKNLTVSGKVEAGSTLKVNGNDLSYDNSGNFTTTITLTEGTNTLTVTAKDTANNSTTLTRTVVLDTTPPDLKIIAPALSSEITNNAGYILNGQSEVGAKVLVNNEQIKLGDSGTFVYTLALKEGSNTISISSTDVAGNTTSKEITIFLDTQPPTGSITINNNEEFTNNKKVTLNLGYKDNDNGSGIKETLISQNENFSNSQTIALSGKSSDYEFTLNNNSGEKAIVYVKYKDKAGNYSQVYSDSIIFDENTYIAETIGNITETEKVVASKDGKTKLILPQGFIENSADLTLVIKNPEILQKLSLATIENPSEKFTELKATNIVREFTLLDKNKNKVKDKFKKKITVEIKYDNNEILPETKEENLRAFVFN
ncbi:MAG: PQQ-binding-like beta-propeller repeat protein, partial [Actinobacteria bacterium]|nr:PQQ-binding-like beta-propeller repeat protein [Actinomycetota bacterium]